MCDRCDAWVSTYYDRHPEARARDARMKRAASLPRDRNGRFARKKIAS